MTRDSSRCRAVSWKLASWQRAGHDEAPAIRARGLSAAFTTELKMGRFSALL